MIFLPIAPISAGYAAVIGSPQPNTLLILLVAACVVLLYLLKRGND